MNVNVSEKTKLKLREIAKKRGQNIEDVAGVIIEKNINNENIASTEGRRLSEMAGMFYGGDENTAERASEILRAEMGENSRGKS